MYFIFKYTLFSLQGHICLYKDTKCVQGHDILILLRINDPQKQKVLHTWELYDVIFNFQCATYKTLCFADRYFETCIKSCQITTIRYS